MQLRNRGGVHSPAMKATALACVLVVGLGLSLQAAHLHLETKLAPATHCPICLGAHVALPSVGTAPVVSQAASPAIRAVTETAGHTQFHSYSLYNRPPPPQA